MRSLLITHHSLLCESGWGGWIRTNECRFQRPVPYHLATPQFQTLASGEQRSAGAERFQIQLSCERRAREDAPATLSFQTGGSARLRLRVVKDTKDARPASSQQRAPCASADERTFGAQCLR